MQSKLDTYLSKTFAGSFFPLFFTLFIISSVVAIIKLADITAVVRLSSNDFLKLYLYGVPQLFFYSVPISFFLAGSISLAKLSFDSEITATIALGATKEMIIKPFAILAIFFTSLLLFLGLVAIPMANATAKSFIDEKKVTSKLNLEPNSVGQKFGDWFVFALGEDKNGSFTDMVLFSRKFQSSLADPNKQTGDKLIYSKIATVQTEDGLPVLKLKNGSALMYDENLSQTSIKKLQFKELSLREEMEAIRGENGYFIEYWKVGLKDSKRAKDFADTVLAAMSPILNILLSFAFGVSMTRRDKNRAVLYSVAAISLYYLLILTISPQITFYAIPVITFIWTIFVVTVYKKSVFSKY